MWETQWTLHCYPHDCSARHKITRCKILSQKNEGQRPFGNVLRGERCEVRTGINLRCEPEKIDMMFICPPSRSARVCWVVALFTNPFSAWSICSQHVWGCIMISGILAPCWKKRERHSERIGRPSLIRVTHFWDCSWWIQTGAFWCSLQCSLWTDCDGYWYNMNPSKWQANCICYQTSPV